MNVQIKAEAILAAVLFGMGKKIPVKVKLSDSIGEIEQEIPLVEVRQEEDCLMAMLPLFTIQEFAITPYLMHFQIMTPPNGEPIAIIGFEKKSDAPSLISADGKPLMKGEGLSGLMAKIFGTAKLDS